MTNDFKSAFAAVRGNSFAFFVSETVQSPAAAHRRG